MRYTWQEDNGSVWDPRYYFTRALANMHVFGFRWARGGDTAKDRGKKERRERKGKGPSSSSLPPFPRSEGPFPFGTHGGDLHTRKEEGKKAHETLPSFSQTRIIISSFLPRTDEEREREKRTFFVPIPFPPFHFLSWGVGRTDLSISLSVFFGPVSL